MKNGNSQEEGAASKLIDAKIKELADWRGETLARIRSLVKEADPRIVEEWKWRGVPVWSHAGIICTGETYRNVVKSTFARGAFVEDPSSLFNASLEGNTRRAIDFREGDEIDEAALKALVRAAVALNEASAAELGLPWQTGKSTKITQYFHAVYLLGNSGRQCLSISQPVVRMPRQPPQRRLRIIFQASEI